VTGVIGAAETLPIELSGTCREYQIYGNTFERNWMDVRRAKEKQMTTD
jgi:hypothetical protein